MHTAMLGCWLLSPGCFHPSGFLLFSSTLHPTAAGTTAFSHFCVFFTAGAKEGHTDDAPARRR